VVGEDPLLPPVLPPQPYGGVLAARGQQAGWRPCETADRARVTAEHLWFAAEAQSLITASSPADAMRPSAVHNTIRTDPS
jgi:hypothetical protein